MYEEVTAGDSGDYLLSKFSHKVFHRQSNISPSAPSQPKVVEK